MNGHKTNNFEGLKITGFGTLNRFTTNNFERSKNLTLWNGQKTNNFEGLKTFEFGTLNGVEPKKFRRFKKNQIWFLFPNHGFIHFLVNWLLIFLLYIDYPMPSNYHFNSSFASTNLDDKNGWNWAFSTLKNNNQTDLRRPSNP